ncbi:phage baseplate assembly protein V [Enterobacter sp. ECC-175]|uniref:phage baseplate assembly protein V n=1 Tax=unclassified Enterobacter TaxID=2608935 RepID=UPI0015EBB47A|nr:phage baseplate assembly protein V [Enterobacter sp. RIT 418]
MSLNIIWEKGRKLATFRLIHLDIRYPINDVPHANLVLAGKEVSMLSLSSDAESDLQMMVPGKSVSIQTGKETLFSGNIVEQQVQFAQGERTVVLTVCHATQMLKTNYRSQIFTEQSDSDVFALLLQNFSAKIEEMRFKHPQLIQFSCSDWQFLKARLQACGLWLVVTPKAVSVMKPALKTSAEVVITPHVSRSIEILRNNSLLPERLDVSSWDIKQQEMRAASPAAAPALAEASLSSAGMATSTKREWHHGYSLSLEEDEQRAFADSRMQLNHISSLHASIILTGDAGYVPGQTLELKGFGKGIDGKALVTAVCHTFQPGDWTTTLEVGADLTGIFHGEMLPGVNGLHIGIVEEDKTQADDDGIHYLAVSMPALCLGKQTINARLSSPFASNGRGLTFWPRKGDEVVLGFFENDPRFPVIVGAMHSPKNKLPDTAFSDGIGLVLQDGQLNQQLVLYPQKGILQEVAKGDVKSSLQLQEGKAMLFTEDALNIEGKKSVTIKGAKVDLNQ